MDNNKKTFRCQLIFGFRRALEEIPEKPQPGVRLQDDQVSLVFPKVGPSHSLHVVRCHRLNFTKIFLGQRPLPGQNSLAHELSQRSIILVPNERPSPDIVLDIVQLPRRNGLFLDPGHLLGNDRFHQGGILRVGSHIHPPETGVGEGIIDGTYQVGKGLLLTDFLVQAGIPA